jgi:hypothetical protein
LRSPSNTRSTPWLHWNTVESMGAWQVALRVERIDSAPCVWGATIHRESPMLL